jgi:hypothetical protein
MNQACGTRFARPVGRFAQRIGRPGKRRMKHPLEDNPILPQRVWDDFGSWLRTIRPGIPPSELVVAAALRQQPAGFSPEYRFTQHLREIRHRTIGYQ